MLESLNKVAVLQVCNSPKKRLQHRCFPVNISKFLRTAFFVEHLRWLLLKLGHFLFLKDATFKIYEDIWHKHNLMIYSSFDSGHLGSIHMKFPMNTYQGEGTFQGKQLQLNIITRLIWDFFQIAISLLAYVATF